MKFLFDLFPVILFFIAYRLSDIFMATATAIVAIFIQIAWTFARYRKVETVQLANFGIIFVLGGMTILLRDEVFIKWKPTVIYWLFGLALCVSQLLFRKNLIKLAIGKEISLPDAVWQRLSLSWVVFFGCLGVINLAVAFAFGFSTDIWVNFNVFGSTGLLLLFVVIQMMFLSKYIEEENKAQGENNGSGH